MQDVIQDPKKVWTQQQTELRRLLSARNPGPAALQLFFSQHAATHTARLDPSSLNWSLEDEALLGLPEDLIRFCPQPGVNSIAWLMWHAARIEDITITTLVLEQPQVLDQANWPSRLGLHLRDVGSGMDEAQVRNFSAGVSIEGLKAYRAAVGASTRDGLRRLPLECLREIVPSKPVYRLVEDGSIGPNAPWLAEFYLNRTRAWFLTRTATSHNFQHIHQAARLRVKLS